MPFDLTTDTQGRLTLVRPGEEDKADVRLRRAFPWSGPDGHISIRDAEGKELLLIDDLQTLPESLRQTINQWLGDTSLTPRITSIQDLDVRFGYQQWKVITDRGPIEFRVQEREDIRFLGDGRFRIKDADGNIYELPNTHSLDAQSRKELSELF